MKSIMRMGGAVLGILGLLVGMNPIQVNANPYDYGFITPTSGYSYVLFGAPYTTLRAYSNSGHALGDATIAAVRLRPNSASGGYYYDVLMTRVEMIPLRTPYGSGYYYWGMNEQSKITMPLNGNQTLVNFAPNATMPSGSSTWSVGFSGGVSGGNFGFNLATGYSSTLNENCYSIYTAASWNTPVITYDYKTTWTTLFNSGGLKAEINKWTTTPHKTFAACTYTTPVGNTNNSTIQYSVSFRYAFVPSNTTWNGDTTQVSSATPGTASISLTYFGTA
ncbi:MAG: hypothetical protein FWF18_03640 [Dehalococcoidia bacterium]|nr:hypothetical protein [Dehalococcoidia bacterium]